jgi:hypothetical protein
MQSSNIPSKIPLPFAYAAGSGYKNTIPTNSLIGIQDGKASLTDGFPPLNFTPVSSGGVPPFGADMNGILNEVTAIQQWQEAGGFFLYDSAFSTTIGGYPKGAILQSSSFNGLWVSTVENNTTNPDTGGAGWNSLSFEGISYISVVSNAATLTTLQAAYPIITISGTLTANATVTFPATVGEWIIYNGTTGAFTLTVKTSSGTGVNIAQSSSQYCWGDGTNIYYANASSVTSFNTRTGAITLNATDVTAALGFTPGNFIGVKYFTTVGTATYTSTTGTNYIIVEVVGGGGGVSNSGGTSSFGSFCSATGGQGGNPGSGGLGSGGDLNAGGGSGGSSFGNSIGNGGTSAFGYGGGSIGYGAGGSNGYNGGGGGGGGGSRKKIASGFSGTTVTIGAGGDNGTAGIVIVYEYA